MTIERGAATNKLSDYPNRHTEFVAKLKSGQNCTHEMFYEILEIMAGIENSLLAFLNDLNPQADTLAHTDKTKKIKSG
jgi:hypothetical protein